MDENVATIIVAMAGAAGTILSFIIGRREKSVASDAASAASISSAYKNLVEDLQTRIEKLEASKANLEARISVLSKQNDELMKQVSENERLRARIVELEEKLDALTRRVVNGN